MTAENGWRPARRSGTQLERRRTHAHDEPDRPTVGGACRGARGGHVHVGRLRRVRRRPGRDAVADADPREHADEHAAHPGRVDRAHVSPTSAPTGGAFTAPGTELSQLPQDGRLTVVDVRIGVHDGYERVVYELAGEGLPGWRVGYVDEAVDDPSGEVLDVAGDATLQVVLLGTAYPMDTGHDELDHDVMGTGGVQQVTRPLTFEGQTQSFVGLDAQRPVRVMLLADPVRVVVDLQTP